MLNNEEKMSRLRDNWQEQIKEIAKFPIIGHAKLSEKEEKHMREIKDYEFYNLEEPGVIHKFSYGSGNKLCTITLFHGQTYHLPRFIARHLEQCAIPIWDWRPDGTGRMIKKKIGKKPRFRLSQMLD